MKVFELLLLLLFGNDHANKYVVLGWLPDSSPRHASYQNEPSLLHFVQPLHVLHEREDEKKGESAVYYDNILGCYAVYILNVCRRFERKSAIVLGLFQPEVEVSTVVRNIGVY